MKRKNKLPKLTFFFGVLAIILFIWACSEIPKGNEGDFIDNAAVAVNGDISAENEGESVFVSGKTKLEKVPEDILTGVSADGFILVRNVEMYQYYLNGDAVYKDFIDHQVMNIEGRSGEKYNNSAFPDGAENSVFLGEVSIEPGSFRIGDDYLYTLSESYPYFTDSHNLIPLDNPPAIDNFTLRDGWYYSGSPTDYKLGDIRISYEYLPADSIKEITLLGRQNGNTIGGADNIEKACMTDSICDKAEFAKAVGINKSNLSRNLFIASAVLFALAAAAYFVSKGKLRKEAVQAALVIFTIVGLTLTPMVNSKADFGDYGGDVDYGGFDSGGYDYGRNDYGGNNDYDYDRTRATTTSYYYYVKYPSVDSSVYEKMFYIINSRNNVTDVETLGLVTPEVDSSSALFGTGSFGFAIGYLIHTIRKKLESKRPNRPSGPRPAGAERTDASKLLPIDDYKQIDTGFDEEEFKAKVSDMYVKFQNSWQKKDMDDLRPYLTDEFYAQCESGLDNYTRNNQTNIIDDIKVESVDLKGWWHDNTNDVIVAELTTEITDYVINDNTGEVVRGNKDARRRMQYEWSLVRQSGITSGSEEDLTKVCPNCGAPLTLNAAGECEYCGSILTMEARDWAVSSIKGLSQRTYYK